MKKSGYSIIVCSFLTAALALPGRDALAVDTEIPADTLTGTQVENAAFSVSPEDYITVMFSEVSSQSFATYSAGTVIASGGSSGMFAGDYIASGVNKLGFRIRSEFDVALTVVASLVLETTDGRRWYNPNVVLSGAGGLWVANNVDFTTSAGWSRDGAGDKNAMWLEDLTKVAFVGIRVAQRGRIAQSYSIDTFVLLDGTGKIVGTSGLVPVRALDYFVAEYGVASMNEVTEVMLTTDRDGDGMTDWNELLAGTDPTDRTSIFTARIVKFEENGITVKWPCASGGKYQLFKADKFRSDFVDGGFTAITGEMSPSWTDLGNGVMTYKDVFIPGNGPYFYKVVVRN